MRLSAKSAVRPILWGVWNTWRKFLLLCVLAGSKRCHSQSWHWPGNLSSLSHHNSSLLTDLHVSCLLHPHSPVPVLPVLRLLSSGILHHLQQTDQSKCLRKMKYYCTCLKEPSKSVVMQNDVFGPQPPSSREESLTSSSSACSLASSSSTMKLSDKKKWGPWAGWKDALTVCHYCRPSTHRMEEDRKTFRNEWVQIQKNRTKYLIGCRVFLQKLQNL